MLFTGNRAFIEDLDDIPFPYPEMIEGKADEDHKIYYYESSRGCPFSCAYCLSSVEKRVRFKSLERTCEEIQFFLDNNIKLVKFVDRTYNLDEERYIGIWDYILKHHNKKTMFHFEIEAEYLSEKALDFLQNVPEGVMQFEMGVQSANKKTLKAINRSANTEELAAKIKRIPRTIHQHLDLIAGLPFEDLESFGKSYDFVMSLRPDALQLGFLKILGGTVMEKYASENGWKWMESPVYETFSTPHLSFGDIAFLKDME
ncbi:radical SAM protein, partial [Treponema sp.]|uniref:B12-binding domain-containing radical SAM protein n=1 Tax=Treponema sp. TaxID=166 RepID=UPI002580EBFB